MGGSEIPRRHFPAQTGAAAAGVALLSDAWLARAVAAGLGEQLVPYP